MDAEQIKRAVRKNWSGNHSTFTEVKGGSSMMRGCPRMDVVALEHSWSPTNIKVVEVKVDRQDYNSDKKWRNYLDYCNEFYFAAPTGLVKRSEVDGKVGLILVNEDTGSVTTVKAATHTDLDDAAAFMMLYYLLTWRYTEVEGCCREDRMRRIRDEMQEREELGERYAGYVSEQLDAAAQKLRKAEAKAKHAERMAEAARGKYERKLENIEEAQETIKAAQAMNLTPDQLRAMAEHMPRHLDWTLDRLRRNCRTLLQGVFGKDLDGEGGGT